MASIGVIDAVILAGGRGQRMGGTDKGLMRVADRPLVAWMLDVVARQSRAVRRVYLSANRHANDYAQFGRAVLADQRTGFVGPLAGIDAAFAASDADWLWVLPCDMPMLPADCLERLMAAATGVQAVIASTDESLQPVVCLAHRSTWGDLCSRLAHGRGSVGGWLMGQSHATVNFSVESFLNANTPAQLGELARRLSGISPDEGSSLKA